MRKIPIVSRAQIICEVTLKVNVVDVDVNYWTTISDSSKLLSLVLHILGC